MYRAQRPFALIALGSAALAMALACTAAPANNAGGSDEVEQDKEETKPAASAAPASSTTPAPVATTPPATTTNATGLPCAVNDFLARNCQTCHGAGSPARGTSVQLTTWAQLQQPTASGMKMYQLAQAKIRAGQMPPTGPLAATELTAFDAWVAGGAPQSTESCTTGGTAVTPTVPTPTVPTPTIPATPCQSSVQCPLGSFCGGGVCTPGCLSSQDCPSGASCIAGQCGGVTTTPPQTGPIGTACVSNAQCAANNVCFQSQCLPISQGPNGGFCIGSFCFQ